MDPLEREDKKVAAKKKGGEGGQSSHKKGVDNKKAPKKNQRLADEGSCDAYVQIDCDDLDTMNDERENLRTKVVTSLNPEWRERHELDNFKYKEGCVLAFSIYDHDKDDMDDFIGKVEVPVPAIGGWSKEQGYPIMTEGGMAQSKGKLFVSLRWRA